MEVCIIGVILNMWHVVEYSQLISLLHNIMYGRLLLWQVLGNLKCHSTTAHVQTEHNKKKPNIYLVMLLMCEGDGSSRGSINGIITTIIIGVVDIFNSLLACGDEGGWEIRGLEICSPPLST